MCHSYNLTIQFTTFLKVFNFDWRVYNYSFQVQCCHHHQFSIPKSPVRQCALPRSCRYSLLLHVHPPRVADKRRPLFLVFSRLSWVHFTPSNISNNFTSQPPQCQQQHLPFLLRPEWISTQSSRSRQCALVLRLPQNQQHWLTFGSHPHSLTSKAGSTAKKT